MAENEKGKSTILFNEFAERKVSKLPDFLKCLLVS